MNETLQVPIGEQEHLKEFFKLLSQNGQQQEASEFSSLVTQLNQMEKTVHGCFVRTESSPGAA